MIPSASRLVHSKTAFFLSSLFTLAKTHAGSKVISFIGFSYFIIDIDGNSKRAVWVKTVRWNREGEIH